jgi:hypothetical protein
MENMNAVSNSYLKMLLTNSWPAVETNIKMPKINESPEPIFLKQWEILIECH